MLKKKKEKNFELSVKRENRVAGKEVSVSFY